MISVFDAGPFTLDSQPGVADGWSSIYWAGTSVLIGKTAATVEAKVQTNRIEVNIHSHPTGT